MTIGTDDRDLAGEHIILVQAIDTTRDRVSSNNITLTVEVIDLCAGQKLFIDSTFESEIVYNID